MRGAVALHRRRRPSADDAVAVGLFRPPGASYPPAMLTRRLLGLALVLSLTAGLAACYPEPETNRVVAIGDSLLLGAMQQGLAARLSERGLVPQIDAKGGRRADQSIDLVEAATRNRPTGVLYLGLGTNDGPNRETFRRDIEALMLAARGWPVVWSLVEGGAALPVNAELRAAVDRYPNLRVIDFNPEVWKNPSYRATDGIHLVPAGYVARAAHITTHCDQYDG